MKRTPLKRTPFKKKPSKPMPEDVLQLVCERSGGEWVNGQCYGGRCENPECPDKGYRLEYHHKIRRSQGGKHTAENIQRLCLICHKRAHGERIII